MIARKTSVTLLLSILFSWQAYALTPAEEAARQSEQRLRENQRFIEEEKRKLLKQQMQQEPSDIAYPDAIKPTITKDPNAPCFDIKEIVLKGSDSLYKRERKKLLGPHLNQCLTLSDIEAIRVKVTNYYIKKGLVMARVYIIPNQNLNDGTLEFQVEEGILDKINLNNEDTRGNRNQIATAFPLLLDEALNLRDVEQGLDQMNRLPSNDATMEIIPAPGKAGKSQVNIKNSPSDVNRIYMGVDNLGSSSTGKERARVSLEHDNLLKHNDKIYLSYTNDLEFNKNKLYSKSFYGNFSMPFGYWTGTFSTSYSEYQSTVAGAVTNFRTSGDTWQHTAKMDRVIWRGQKGKTSLNTALTLKDTENFLEDQKLETSSRKLTVLDLGVSHTHRVKGGVYSGSASYVRGLNLLGALEDPDITIQTGTPRAQFEKWVLDVNAYTPIVKNVYYNGTLGAQYSRHTLFGSEQISMGDGYTVRGFRDSAVSGDSGIYLKNDVSYKLPAIGKNGLSQKLTHGLEPYIGFDIGHVNSHGGSAINGERDKATISGATIGVKHSIAFMKNKRIDLDFAYSDALHAPSFVDEKNHEIYFALTLKAF